uniref:Dynactin subunit 6 n=1 Tax=Acanthochromis polyacanthus TaxID=80966 RepID=A0A3Q1ETN4_9TELE
GHFLTLHPRFFCFFHSVKIAAGAVVCVESEIRGDVTIGPRTVVHPKARIIAEAGPIVIGEGNLIEEQALIINSYPENITPDSEVEPKTMTIGINNVFEVGCVSQALKIGDNNVIESKADVGRNVILTSGCIIGAFCQVNTCEVIPENTVIYGSGCMRRVQTERPQVWIHMTGGHLECNKHPCLVISIDKSDIKLFQRGLDVSLVTTD